MIGHYLSLLSGTIFMMNILHQLESFEDLFHTFIHDTFLLLIIEKLTFCDPAVPRIFLEEEMEQIIFQASQQRTSFFVAAKTDCFL